MERAHQDRLAAQDVDLGAKLAAAAEQLPAALEAAEKTKPGYTQFLHDLLDAEL